MTSVPHQTGARLEALDCLRGIAILGVFGYHALGAAFGTDRFTFIGFWPDWSAHTRSFAFFCPLTLGWAGVQLFFIASGFSIHYSTLVHPERYTSISFIGRRFWRIVPTYVLAVIALVALEKCAEPRPWISWQFWSHVFLVHDFGPRTFFGINPSFWSLAVEWHIYLLYPLMLLCRRSLALPLLLFVSCFATQAVAAYGNFPEEIQGFLGLSILVNTAHWWLGAMLASRYVSGGRLFRDSWLLPLMLLFVFSTLFGPLKVVEKTAAALACAALCEWLLHRPTLIGGAFGRGLAFVGLVSYSLYLWHQPILYWVANYLPWHPAIRLALLLACLPATLLLSWVSYRLLEQPSMDLGKRLARSRAYPVQVPPPARVD